MRISARLSSLCLFVTIALSSFLAIQPALAADSVLTISGGKIRGTHALPGENVMVYRGIPYAAPPVGGLRWKPPQPVAPWSGIRDCMEFGPSCLQPAQKRVPQVKGTLFVAQLPVKRPLGYKLVVRRLFGNFSDQVLRMFPASSPEEVSPAIARLTTVGAFVAPTRRTARLFSSHQSQVWLYQFTHVPRILKQRDMGATHAAELFFVFQNMPAGTNANSIDSAVANTMHCAWQRFAVNGNPNGGDLPMWPAFTRENDTYMEFGERARTRSGLLSNACDLFDQIRRARMESSDDLLLH